MVAEPLRPGQLRVERDGSRSRYAALLDGSVVGVAEFVEHGDVVAMTHTFVEPAQEGRGIGTILAREALADLRRRGLRVDPRCPFIAAHIARNPGSAELASG